MSSRYTIIGSLASGGMGTVFLARMAGSAGFSRLVAIKRLHPELAAQREFIAMLVDEARLASQVRHVNVINTLDLVASDGAFSVVLEYVEGPSLSGLIRGQAREAHPGSGAIPLPIAIAVTQGLLRGLDAAHEARGSEGQPLGIVHRDVSPQNVLVGIDGIPRIIDFGIAKAMGRVQSTRPGEVRGKFAYMAPEQLLERPATRQVDVYAAGVVLWELVTGERLFKHEDQRAVANAVMRGEIKPPSSVNKDIPAELDAIILKATSRELSERYLSAREFLDALVSFKRATDDEVGEWVRRLSADFLAKRSMMLQSVVADHSRSVEDLLAELEQSATPSSSRIPVSSKARIPATETAPTPLQGQLPAPHVAGFGAEPHAEEVLSQHGMTSAGGVEVAAGVPANNGRLLYILIPAACLAGLLLIVGVIYDLRKNPPHPVNVTASPPPPPVTTTIDVPTEPSIDVAPTLSVAATPPPPMPAPSASSSAPAPRRPPWRHPHPKRDPSDHP